MYYIIKARHLGLWKKHTFFFKDENNTQVLFGFSGFLVKGGGGVHSGGCAEHPECVTGLTEEQRELRQQNARARTYAQRGGHTERPGQGTHTDLYIHEWQPNSLESGRCLEDVWMRTFLSVWFVLFVCRLDWRSRKPLSPTSHMWRSMPLRKQNLSKEWQKPHK